MNSHKNTHSDPRTASNIDLRERLLGRFVVAATDVSVILDKNTDVVDGRWTLLGSMTPESPGQQLSQIRRLPSFPADS